MGFVGTAVVVIIVIVAFATILDFIMSDFETDDVFVMWRAVLGAIAKRTNRIEVRCPVCPNVLYFDKRELAKMGNDVDNPKHKINGMVCDRCKAKLHERILALNVFSEARTNAAMERQYIDSAAAYNEEVEKQRTAIVEARKEMDRIAKAAKEGQ